MNWIVSFLLAYFARPYRKGHLHHADGTLYMERFSLWETKWFSARLHYIATEDKDLDMHDHPWNFVSVVLQGGYTEERPNVRHKPIWISGKEACTSMRRNVGSVAFRRATDRHLISHVDEHTWTLFFYGIGVQWWGFYTRAGKVHWADYLRMKGRRSDVEEMDEYLKQGDQHDS